MDPKGKGMVVNDNEKESVFNKPRDDKSTNSGSSHKKKDGKKRRIKKIVYYNNDESSSSQRDDDDEKKKTVNSNFSFDYSRIPFNSNAHFLSIPLGKPPHFDGEDYLSAFRDRAVPGPTSEMSSRAPTQMGRREAEREGGKKGGRRRA
jgi:hypothetical protein